MHSFEVHSNESACKKKVRLGMEQVFNVIPKYTKETIFSFCIKIFTEVWSFSIDIGILLQSLLGT